MKTKSILLATGILLAVATACSSDETEMIVSPTPETSQQDSLYTYDMVLNAEKPSYDDEPATRATNAGAWEDGDQIFISFSNGGSSANARGTYHASTGTWTIICEKNLTEISNASCTVAYAKGKNPVEKVDGIYYDYMTACYKATGGKYSFASGIVSISAKLMKQGWRMRFKGTSGTQIMVWASSNRFYYFYQSDFTATYRAGSFTSISLTVGPDGYTDYFVVHSVISSCTNIVITNTTTGDSYYRYFDGNMVKSGNSYYYTIPTTTNLHGWSKSNVATGKVNGYEYVDLGLLEGTKWARVNLGASSESDPGNYYAWGETAPKSSYSSSNYTYSGDGDLSGSADAATVNWGSGWRMPTLSEFQSLYNNCVCSSITLNGMSGYMYVGKNGKSIFLPATGYYGETKLTNPDYLYFWTSDSESSYAIYWDGSWYSGATRPLGLAIRPVIAD